MKPKHNFFPRTTFWVYFCSLHTTFKITMYKSQSWHVKPVLFNLAIRRSWEKHSNAFDKSVRHAPNDFLLSAADFKFARIDTRQCSALKFFSTLIFREKRNFKIFWHLFKHNPFIKFGDVWQYIDWSIIIFCTFWVLSLNRCYICQFQHWWL